MTAKKPTVKLLEALTDTDKKVLEAIYNHRCLNEDLIYQFFYRKDDIAREHTAKRIRWMIQKGFLTTVDYGEDFPALFLTTMGIETYRYVYQLPTEVIDIETGKMKKALHLASELKMRPNNLRHQMALNKFGLMFEERMDHRAAYTYLDEKFIDLYTIIRPDGIIKFNHMDIFLEMDMGTEASKTLMGKWNHYREFLKSKDYRYKDKKMAMLFIVNNVSRVDQRRSTVMATMQIGLLDTLDSFFEVYVDTPDHLLDIIFNRLAPTANQYTQYLENLCNEISHDHQFVFSSSSFMKSLVPDMDFFAYIRKLNPDRNILIQDGRPQEFLFDTFIDRPVSVMKKISYYQTMCVAMLSRLHRKIPYLVVVQDEESFYHELKIMQVMNTSGIFFTTERRLRSMDFPGALFQYDDMGNLFHFKDFGLQARVFERKV